ncbi:MAG: hypothetical protein J7M18_04970 [Candidatus Eremiobacteraeota bacterium]|nr:hypothetical protein [Candidatus Eremiobacteraeota bacterium]
MFTDKSGHTYGNGKSSRRGIAFIVVLLLAIILFLLAITLATISSRLRIAGKIYSVRSVICQFAQMGIEEAIHYLAKNNRWDQAGGPGGFIPTDEVSAVLDDLTVYYRLEVLNYNINKVTVRSRAYLKDVLGNPTITRSATITVVRDASPFQYGVFGAQRMRFILASTVDSYDSSIGPYSATSQTTGGDVGTNSLENFSIYLSWFSWIYGNIYLHPQADPEKVVYQGFGSGFSGSIENMSEAFPLPPVTPPTGTSMGDVVINGETRELPPGIYSNLTLKNKAVLILRSGNYVFNRITMRNESEIRLKDVTVPAVVYLKDDVEAAHDGGGGVMVRGGSIVNTTQKPPLLYIMAGTNCQRILLMGRRHQGPSCYFAIYAPNANILMYGNSEIYGAMIGKTVTIFGNSAVHFDQALKYSIISPQNMRFASYQMD